MKNNETTTLTEEGLDGELAQVMSENEEIGKLTASLARDTIFAEFPSGSFATTLSKIILAATAIGIKIGVDLTIEPTIPQADGDIGIIH